MLIHDDKAMGLYDSALLGSFSLLRMGITTWVLHSGIKIPCLNTSLIVSKSRYLALGARLYSIEYWILSRPGAKLLEFFKQWFNSINEKGAVNHEFWLLYIPEDKNNSSHGSGVKLRRNWSTQSVLQRGEKFDFL